MSSQPCLGCCRGDGRLHRLPCLLARRRTPPPALNRRCKRDLRGWRACALALSHRWPSNRAGRCDRVREMRGLRHGPRRCVAAAEGPSRTDGYFVSTGISWATVFHADELAWDSWVSSEPVTSAARELAGSTGHRRRSHGGDRDRLRGESAPVMPGLRARRPPRSSRPRTGPRAGTMPGQLRMLLSRKLRTMRTVSRLNQAVSGCCSRMSWMWKVTLAQLRKLP